MSKKTDKQQQEGADSQTDIFSMDSGILAAMKKENVNKAFLELWDICIGRLNEPVGAVMPEFYELMRSKKSNAVPHLFGKDPFGTDQVVMSRCSYFNRFFLLVGDNAESFNVKLANASGYESLCAEGAALYKARRAEYNKAVLLAKSKREEAKKAYKLAKTQDAKGIASDQLFAAEAELEKAEDILKNRETTTRGYTEFSDVLQALHSMGYTDIRKYGGVVSAANPEYKWEQ